MLEKDKAICIRKTDYSETSQIVTLLTENFGKISAIAKGSRRSKSNSFGGKIELFSFGEIVFSPSKTSSLATLTEFDQKPVFIGVSRNLYNLNCAMFAMELIHSLTEEHDPHAELFALLYEFLSEIQLCAGKEKSLGVLIKFQLALLEELGVALAFEQCSNCGTAFSAQWQGAWFSSENNGFVCRDCESAFVDKLQISMPIALSLFNQREFLSLEFSALEYIERFLIRHLTFLLNRPPRLARFFL